MDEHRRKRAALVGRNIKLARKLVGMSQDQLAQLLEMERGDVSKWENGIHEPRAHNLARLAAALDQTEGFFFQDHANDGEAVA